MKQDSQQPEANPIILSDLFDVRGHRIRRIPGNRLLISRTERNAGPCDQAEADEVSRWFWRAVGLPGNDPDTTR